jgi:multiple sugar transport system permease protein
MFKTLIFSLSIIFFGLIVGYIIQQLEYRRIIQLSISIGNLRKLLQKIALLFFMPISTIGTLWIIKMNNIKIVALPFLGIFALFAGYGLGRFKFGGPNLSFFVLSLLFAPPIIAVLPLFIIFRYLRIVDNYIALIWSYFLINLPFVIWLIKGFIEDLPEEIESAALVDGYSRFGAFRKVTLPLIIPGVVVSALFVFVFAWNEFLFALMFTRSNVRTLPVVLSELIGGHGIQWGELSALSLIAIIPGVILVVFFQKYLVRGLTFGAVKG